MTHGSELLSSYTLFIALLMIIETEFMVKKSLLAADQAIFKNMISKDLLRMKSTGPNRFEFKIKFDMKRI